MTLLIFYAKIKEVKKANRALYFSILLLNAFISIDSHCCQVSANIQNA